ncbi:D-arabinose 1-dehydrogenase, Zn-dependent alcohol dehydrogenase family [Geosmithia morbida]|uniref:D-arabinose 1-dehydrogenase, Zn-dependent alcohol dehydrogenase family n=1 Tax=Geosmithia morbida TaxID=1094350 RepID=A0A9P4YQR7_9HYPO|nr:D-arabinose 1-dehydrogenase, Zn-dependent alcohol dehydrogenase family [Geosmithia morbida]KAF4119309.1 D-arabinose 1-dehydrogenase, Zn-dependent alcohol dehydrogenase family [Geosmithia morbida]
MPTPQYRDLIITKGLYPFALKPDTVPGSDGAGDVVAVGRNVRRFKVGDKVVTLFNQGHIGGELDQTTAATGLGGVIDGTLREYGAFEENGLVPLPRGLDYVEGATLTCAGLTAWNGLYGLEGKRLTPGQWVLTQGTGGVSIFAVQFAKAAGARVIATTSSADRAGLLRKLGADHIINYREKADWGEEARSITGGVGVDHVIEVAGPTSMAQSLKAVRIGGVISIIGFVGGAARAEGEPGFLDSLVSMCTVRGFLVGSRTQMEEMNLAIEGNIEKLRPVVDSKTFTLDQVKEAYEYQWSGKHQSKVGIKIA